MCANEIRQDRSKRLDSDAGGASGTQAACLQRRGFRGVKRLLFGRPALVRAIALMQAGCLRSGRKK